MGIAAGPPQRLDVILRSVYSGECSSQKVGSSRFHVVTAISGFMPSSCQLFGARRRFCGPSASVQLQPPPIKEMDNC